LLQPVGVDELVDEELVDDALADDELEVTTIVVVGFSSQHTGTTHTVVLLPPQEA